MTAQNLIVAIMDPLSGPLFVFRIPLKPKKISTGGHTRLMALHYGIPIIVPLENYRHPWPYATPSSFPTSADLPDHLFTLS